MRRLPPPPRPSVLIGGGAAGSPGPRLSSLWFVTLAPVTKCRGGLGTRISHRVTSTPLWKLNPTLRPSPNVFFFVVFFFAISEYRFFGIFWHHKEGRKDKKKSLFSHDRARLQLSVQEKTKTTTDVFLSAQPVRPLSLHLSFFFLILVDIIRLFLSRHITMGKWIPHLLAPLVHVPFQW